MPKSRLWTEFTEVIWDGPRSREEKLLVQKLDLFLMTWATYGYFVRLLDSYNVTNAYVSGMKEDLNVKGDDYNLFTTFFNVGYICSQVPSQLLLTRIRPSYYLPTAELIWSVVTFCFAAVQTVEQVFALRFLIGVFEAPFAVGVVTVMGNYYTPRELAKRIAIFYSAAYVASMFSGYLQAAIYKGLNGHLGLAGWRWLFIFCGIISLPGAFYGYYAIPDTPYRTRAPWIKPEDRLKYIERMETVKRSPPVRLSWRKIRKVVTHWPIYAFTLTLIAHCVATQPLNYLPVWLKSLNRFSVYQINLLPTAAQGLALVTTLGYAWTSDYLNTPSARWQIMLVPAVLDLLGMLCVLIPAATTPADQQQPFGVTFFGYFINACSWGYWPLVFSWINEICRDDAEERAIVIGVCQTVGLAFTAWLPVVVLNVGKYAPRFTLGFAVMTGFSVLELLNVFILRACARWEAKKKQREGHSVDDERMEDSEEAAVIVVGPGVPDPLVMVEK